RPIAWRSPPPARPTHSGVGGPSVRGGLIGTWDVVLNKGAALVAVRAEDTAVAGLRTEHGPAVQALVEEDALVGRHRRLRDVPAVGTREPNRQIRHSVPGFLPISDRRSVGELRADELAAGRAVLHRIHLDADAPA